MTNGEFTCSRCAETFDAEWSDEESLDEMEENFGTRSTEGMALICDDCYKAMMEQRRKEMN